MSDWSYLLILFLLNLYLTTKEFKSLKISFANVSWSKQAAAHKTADYIYQQQQK